MRARTLVVAALLGAPIAPLSAQQPVDTIRVTLGDRTPRAPGVPAIAGIVVDRDGRGLDSVTVFVSQVRKTASTRPDGTFLVPDVKPGTYIIAARRLGFRAQARPVIVGEQGGTAVFVLLPMEQRLPPVVSSSPRGGLSGVIGDTAFGVVAGARIEVMGEGARAESDSAGLFHIPIRPGRYMVRVSAPGFATKVVSVSIPRDSGRRILALLEPSLQALSNREAVAQFDLAQRRVRTSNVWSKMYTRYDINDLQPRDLMALVARAGGRPREECPVLLNGGPYTAPMWGIPISEVEAVEVYVRRPPRNAPRSIMNRSPQRTSTVLAGCDSEVYVWLRQ